MKQQREQDALEAYLRLMEGKGANAGNLERRRSLLGKLIPVLADQPVEGWVYRDAIDETMPLIERNDWPFFLALTRDFFPFWSGDIKAIAALHSSGGFEIEQPAPTQTEESLKQLWKRLDTEKFEVAEMWPLKAYIAGLREEGAEKPVVETRQKLVKLLLIHLREVSDKNGKAYRAVVESMLPLFVMKETRFFFLHVVREFFYFWIGDPDASSHIMLEQT